MYKYNHSETTPGEICVGNTNVTEGIIVPAHLSTLKTARLGNIALDIHGKPIDPNYYRPLYIHNSEAIEYDRIMMARLKDINTK